MNVLVLEPDARTSAALTCALQKRGHAVECLARKAGLTGNGMTGFRFNGTAAAAHFGDSKRVRQIDLIQAAFVSPSLPFHTTKRILDVDRNSAASSTVPIVTRLNGAGVFVVLVGIPDLLLPSFGRLGEDYDFHLEGADLEKLLASKVLPEILLMCKRTY